MASQFFDQLSGPLSEILPVESWYERTVKYGIRCDTVISRDDTIKYTAKRPGATFTNVLTTFGTFDVKFQQDINVTDGINVKVLNDYGQYDYNLVNEQLRLSGMKAENAVKIAGSLANQQNENVVALLVNLIRFWIIKSSAIDKLKFNKDDIFYDDGHAAVSYEGYLQQAFNNEPVMSFGRAPSLIPWNEHMVISDSVFLPCLIGFNERDVHILRKYMGDIKCSHPSRLMFDTPQLTDQILMKDIYYNEPVNEVTDTADEVFQVLSKFVFANRCQSQFDLAYTFVVMSMYSPLPRAIEANAWVSPSNTMILPQVGTARGLSPNIVGGIAYSTRPEAELTWTNFCANRNRIYVHAIAACEALFGGIFEIMTAGGGLMTEFFSSFGVTSASMATPWRMMQECAAYRFGKAFETNWQTPCGPNLLAGLLVDQPVQREIEVIPRDKLDGYEVYKVSVKGAEVTRIRAKFMRPAIFPVLSYGINDDRYYLNKKQYSAEMTFRPDIMALVSSESDQVNKMMCIMRIAGLDCEVIDKFTGDRHKNWAANSNGQVMPIFNPNDITSAFIMPVRTITERPMNWMPVMSVTEKMRLSVDITIRDYVVFANGRNVGVYNRVYRPVVRTPRPIDKMEMVEFVVKTGSQQSSYRYQDFLMATIGIPVEKETLSLAPLAMEPALPTEEQIVTAGALEALTEEQMERDSV